MAAYFHGSAGTEIQAADGLQTLYLMNPNYVGYTDPSAAAPANMVLLNSAMNTMTAASFGHTTPGPQHFVGIPLQPSPAAAAADPSRGVNYNLWGPAMQVDVAAAASSQATTSLPARQQQGGLSLSLYPREMAAPPVTVAMTAPVATEEGKVTSGEAHGLVMSSKYLKAAQMLLDEVVSVGKGSRLESNGKSELAARKKKREGSEEGSGVKSGKTDDGGGKNGGGAELSTAERQELQMKKAKLVNMLDEVEQRYRQYHHQMQIVVSSFEAVAGPGSVRTYTALALQTISKQFRCLRDAIAGQIRATSRSLGEDETKTVGSRLRYIDHQLRQQRALQQLGMMQHNAWRPQRGLPERSVSILRSWLFEHFLHPYPKDSDKIMLAKQTGLTRSQVSNWFINARVRLWKPMVEEMYVEETKDPDQNSGDGEDSSKNSSEKDPATKSNTKPGQSEGSKSNQNNNYSMDPKRSSVILTTPELVDQQSQRSFFDDEANLQSKFERARSDEPFHPTTMSEPIGVQMRTELSNRELLLKFMGGSARDGAEQGYSLFSTNANNSNSFGEAAYPMGEMNRFSSEQFAPRYGGNGVSLSLGLPHCEGLSLSGAPSFLSNESMVIGSRLDMGRTEASDYCSLNNSSNTAVAAHSANAYDINMQNRKSLAAQLMRDFVA